MYYVYALVDPVNKVPFYIGKGKNNRVWEHLSGKDKHNKRKCAYIESIRAIGLEPEVGFIEENIKSDAEAYSSEDDYIKLAYDRFPDVITNRLGIFRPVWTQKSLEKRSKTVTGKKRGPYKGKTEYARSYKRFLASVVGKK